MSANDRSLNVVLIGLGMVAGTHLQAIADLAGQIQLQGIFARRPESMAKFAEQAQQTCGYAVRCYESVESIAADTAVDFAIVLTPPNARLDIVDKLSAANIPLLLEKPIERDTDAATHIVELCEQRQVPLGIVFQHRAREASIKLTEFVRQGAFGALVLVEVNVPWWREQSYYDEPGRGTYSRDGGGVLISQAIHTLELMLSLTGQVETVQAMCRTTTLHDMEAEDFVVAGLTFTNSVVGSLVATTASFPGDAESITLHFDRAVARLQRGTLSVHWRDGRQEEYGAQANTGGGADPMAFTTDWHRDVIADFAKALRDNAAPMVSGREALGVHRLIDALVQSSREQRVIKLDG